MTSASVSFIRRALGFATPVMLGLLALLLMKRAREDPPRRPPSEQGTPVRVLSVARTEVTPRVVGYGIVRSSREWSLVAEVSGRVVAVHDQLVDGGFIAKGERLLKIDPTDFKISANQQKASVSGVKAQLSELKAREKNTRASLEYAERALELAEKDLARTKQLHAQGSLAESEVDAVESNVLSQRQSVQSYKAALSEMPAQRRALQAQVAQSEASVENAELAVARTEIMAPFDLRIRSANVERSELVSVGATLAEGDGIALAEVPAQFPIGSLRPVFRGPPAATGRLAAGLVAKAGSGVTRPELLQRWAQANVRATVRLKSGSLVGSWAGQFDRFSTIESSSRTVTVVVSVDDPLRQSNGSPPLVSGMYVEVELEGEPRSDCMPIPREALRGTQVQVVDEGLRLSARAVEVSFVQDDYACIASGLEDGDRVVLTEVVPAIEGTLLAPRDDARARAGLLAAVSGEAEGQ